ncbi:hypothetical protein ACSBR1_007653 [Camellia fascicularis]
MVEYPYRLPFSDCPFFVEKLLNIFEIRCERYYSSSIITRLQCHTRVRKYACMLTLAWCNHLRSSDTIFGLHVISKSVSIVIYFFVLAENFQSLSKEVVAGRMDEKHTLGLSSYSMGAPTSKFFVVELNIDFKGSEYMIENVLLKIDKVESVFMDAKQGKVTIKGSADPHHVIKAVLVEKRPQMKQFAWGGCSGGGNVGGASPEQAPSLPRDFPPPKPPPGYNYVPSAPPLLVVGGYHCRGGIDGRSGDSDGHRRRGPDGGSGGHGNRRSDCYRHSHGTDGRSSGYGGGRNGYRLRGTRGHDSGDSDGFCHCYRHGIDGGRERAGGGHDMSNSCRGIGASSSRPPPFGMSHFFLLWFIFTLLVLSRLF